jgi:AraC-like DNA-binding protein
MFAQPAHATTCSIISVPAAIRNDKWPIFMYNRAKMECIQLAIGNLREIQNANFIIEPTNSTHPDRRLHVHDFLYTLSGERHIVQGDQEYHLTDGDVLILFSDLHHYGNRASDGEIRSMYIHIYPHSKDVLHHGCDLRPSGSRFVFLPVLVRTKNDIMIKQLFEEVIYCWYSKRELEKVRSRVVFHQLLLEIARFVQNLKTDHSDDIEYVTNLIERNFAKHYTTDELAAKVDMSCRALTRKFREITGKSIVQYRLENRIKIATSLLQTHSHISLKELSYMLGFCDEFYFSRVFKQLTGKSPSKFK